MSLSVALQVAQSALAARQTETSAISRNIAGAQDPGYSRKSVMLSTLVSTSGQAGGVRVEGIGRATNDALYTNLLNSTSLGSSQQSVLDGLTKLSYTIDDTELELSPSANIGKLKQSLQALSTDPNNAVLAQDLLVTSQQMARTLRDSADAVQTVRIDSDEAIAESVDTINQLLTQFEELNDTIKKGVQLNVDVTDALDTRDQVLLQLSEEVGITTLARENGDMAIYTDSGATLFETNARTVTFNPSTPLLDGQPGNQVLVDGVPITGTGAIMAAKTGNIVGLTTVRDEVAVTYQRQLDEIARGLIEQLQETGGAPGLFIADPAVTLPPPNAGGSIDGLASAIIVNPAVDPDQGGNLDLLRDGINVNYNPAGNAGFNDRLLEMLGALDQDRAFDAATQLDPTSSLATLASSSVGWLESSRKVVTSDVQVQSVVVSRTATNLANATGVNIDEEMSRLLEIERSYAAASKIITAVDRMLDDLLQAVR